MGPERGGVTRVPRGTELRLRREERAAGTPASGRGEGDFSGEPVGHVHRPRKPAVTCTQAAEGSPGRSRDTGPDEATGGTGSTGPRVPRIATHPLYVTGFMRYDGAMTTTETEYVDPAGVSWGFGVSYDLTDKFTAEHVRARLAQFRRFSHGGRLVTLHQELAWADNEVEHAAVNVAERELQRLVDAARAQGWMIT